MPAGMIVRSGKVTCSTVLAEAFIGVGLTAVIRVGASGLGKPSTLSCLAKFLVSILTRIAVPFSGFFHVST
jgi:hypothetical protein